MRIAEGVYFYEKPGMGQHGAHTYVIVGSQKTLLIDPGLSRNLKDLVIAKMVNDGLNPKEVDLIANTHLHADHSEADEECAKICDGWITMHRSQLAFLDTEASTSGIFIVPKSIDSSYDSEIDLGGVRVRILETPGHAPGHVCFYIREKRLLVSGDIIFEKNVGRVDLPGSDETEEKASVKKIGDLDLDFLLPSHGKVFRSNAEVRQNIDFVLKNWALLEYV